MTNFNYSSCSTSNVPINVHFLDIQPDPIRFGELIFVTLNLTLGKDVGCPNNSLEVMALIKCIFNLYQKIKIQIISKRSFLYETCIWT